MFVVGTRRGVLPIFARVRVQLLYKFHIICMDCIKLGELLTWVNEGCCYSSHASLYSCPTYHTLRTTRQRSSRQFARPSRKVCMEKITKRHCMSLYSLRIDNVNRGRVRKGYTARTYQKRSVFFLFQGYIARMHLGKKKCVQLMNKTRYA